MHMKWGSFPAGLRPSGAFTLLTLTFRANAVRTIIATKTSLPTVDPLKKKKALWFQLFVDG